MLVAYQSQQPGQPGTGMGVYNISNPEEPRQIGFMDLGGEYSRGCHCLWWVDGEYAHLSTGAADFQPRNQKDDQFYMIVDVKDPTNPREAGRWWFPGTREGDAEPMPARHPQFDAGHRLHNGNVYPERPDRAYCAYMDSGVIILDIEDKSNPKMLSHINYAPPFPGFTHTVLPLFSRDLMLVTQEAVRLNGEDYPKLMWMMDIRDETNPIIIGTLPMPDTDDFFNRPGRFGAHNVYENQPGPTCFHSENLISPPCSTPAFACTTPPIPSTRRRWPTSCRKYPMAPLPMASMTLRGRERHHVRGGSPEGRPVHPRTHPVGPSLHHLQLMPCLEVGHRTA